MFVSKVLPRLIRPTSYSKNGVTLLPRIPASSAASKVLTTSDSIEEATVLTGIRDRGNPSANLRKLEPAMSS
jgi:hypothetical protein